LRASLRYELQSFALQLEPVVRLVDEPGCRTPVRAAPSPGPRPSPGSPCRGPTCTSPASHWSATYYCCRSRSRRQRKSRCSASISRLQLPSVSKIEESATQCRIGGSIRHFTQLHGFFPPPRCRGYFCFRCHDCLPAIGSAGRGRLPKDAFHISAPLPRSRRECAQPLAAMGISCLSAADARRDDCLPAMQTP
jgi:hypothetical protein